MPKAIRALIWELMINRIGEGFTVQKILEKGAKVKVKVKVNPTLMQSAQRSNYNKSNSI